MGKTINIFGWLVTAVLVIFVAGLAFIYFSPDYDLRLVRSESMRPAVNVSLYN